MSSENGDSGKQAVPSSITGEIGETAALIFIPYYLYTNPAGVRNASRAVEQVLADFRANGCVECHFEGTLPRTK